MAAVAGDKKVNVSIRVRPLIQREIDSQEIANWHNDGQFIQQCVPGTETWIHTQPGYTFDFIFGQNTNTAEVYKKVVAPIVQNSFQGFNGTVLCYGQTSSGKTHTLYGCKLDEGIISLTAQDLFNRINEDKSRTYYIRIGLLEVYNEKVSDLLNEGGHVEIKEMNGVVVPKGLKEIEIVSAEDMLNAAKKVQTQRKIGETRMNKESSRSHTILRIIIDSVPNETDEGEVQVTTALLNFVDLAGSEKASQTGAVGERFKESTFINKSLSTLSQVMLQLSGTMNSGSSTANSTLNSNSSLSNTGSQSTKQPSQFVNFRDSKLTRILQSSLNGNAYISLICNVTPVAVEETHSTLRFAKTAKKIKIEPTKNHGPANATQFRNKIMELENLLNGKNTEVERLKKQLSAMQKFHPLPHQLSGGGIQPDRRKTMCPSMLSGLRNYEGSGGSLDKPLTTDDVDFKIPSNSTFRRTSIAIASPFSSSSMSSFDNLLVEKGSHDDMGLRFAKFPRIDENEIFRPIMIDAEAQTVNSLTSSQQQLPQESSGGSSSSVRTAKRKIEVQTFLIADEFRQKANEWKEHKSFLEHENQFEMEEVESLRMQLDALEKSKEEFRTKLEKLSGDFEKCQEQNSKLKDEVQCFKEEKAKFEKVSHEFQIAQDSIQQLECQNLQLKTRSKDHMEAHEELSKELKQVMSEKSLEQKDYHNMQSNLETIRLDLEQTRNENLNLKEKIILSDKIQENLNVDLQVLQSQNQSSLSLNAEAARIQDSNEKLISELAALQELLNTSNVTHKKSMTEAKASYDTLEKYSESIKSQLQKAEEDSDILQEQLKGTLEKVEEYKQLEQNLNELREKIDFLETENSSLQKEASDKLEAEEKLIMIIRSLEDQVVAIRSENLQLSENLVSLAGKIEAMNTEAAKTIETVESLGSTNETVLNQRNELQLRCVNLESQAEKLSSQIESKDDELSEITKSFSSLKNDASLLEQKLSQAEDLLEKFRSIETEKSTLEQKLLLTEELFEKSSGFEEEKLILEEKLKQSEKQLHLVETEKIALELKLSQIEELLCTLRATEEETFVLEQKLFQTNELLEKSRVVEEEKCMLERKLAQSEEQLEKLQVVESEKIALEIKLSQTEELLCTLRAIEEEKSVLEQKLLLVEDEKCMLERKLTQSEEQLEKLQVVESEKIALELKLSQIEELLSTLRATEEENIVLEQKLLQTNELLEKSRVVEEEKCMLEQKLTQSEEQLEKLRLIENEKSTLELKLFQTNELLDKLLVIEDEKSDLEQKLLQTNEIRDKLRVVEGEKSILEQKLAQSEELLKKRREIEEEKSILEQKLTKAVEQLEKCSGTKTDKSVLEQKLIGEADELREKLVLLENENSDLQRKLKEAEALQEMFKVLSKEKLDLENKLLEAKEIGQANHDKLEVAYKNEEQLQRKLKEAQELQLDLLAKETKLKEQLSACEAEIENLNTKKTNEKAIISEAHLLRETVKKEAELKSKIVSLENVKISLEQQLLGSQAYLRDLQSNLKLATVDKTDLEEKLAILQVKTGALELEKWELDKKLTDAQNFEDQVAVVKEKNLTLKLQLLESKDERERLSSDCDSLHEQLIFAGNENLALVNSLNDEANSVKLLESQLLEITEAKSAVVVKLEHITDKLTNASQDLEKIRDQNCTFKDELQLLLSQLATSEAENLFLKKEIIRTDEVHKVYETLSKDVCSLQEQISTLEDEKLSIQNSLNEAQAQLCLAMEEGTGCAAKLKELSEEKIKLFQEINDLRSNFRDSEAQLQECKVQVLSLQQNLADSEKNREINQKVSNELTAMNSKLEMLASEKLALANSLLEADIKLKSNEEEQKRLTEILVELETANNDNDVLQQQIQLEIDQRSKIARDFDVLQVEYKNHVVSSNAEQEVLSKVQRELEEVRRQLEDVKSVKVSLEEQMKVLATEKEGICRELIVAHSTIQAATGENKDLIDKLTIFQSQLAQVEMEKQRIDEAFEIQFKQLRSEKNAIEEQHLTKNENQLKQFTVEFGTLQEEFKRREDDWIFKKTELNERVKQSEQQLQVNEAELLALTHELSQNLQRQKDMEKQQKSTSNSAELISLQERLESTQKENKSFKELLERACLVYKTQEKELEDITKEKETKTEECAQLKYQLTSLQNRIDALTEESNRVEEILTDFKRLSNEREHLKTQLELSTEEKLALHNKVKEFEKMREEYKKLDVELQRVQSTMKLLAKENGDLKQELNTAEEKLRSATSQGTSLKEIILQSRELQEKHDCILSKFEELQSRSKTQEDENLALKEQVSASKELATKNQCLISEYEALSKKFGELENENSVKIDEIQNLSQKLFQAQTNAAITQELQESYENLLKQFEVQEIKLKETQAENSKAQNVLSEREAEHSRRLKATEMERKSLEHTVETVQKQSKQMEGSMKVLKEDLLRMQTESEAANKSYQNAVQNISGQSKIVECQVAQLKELRTDLQNKVKELDEIKQEYVKSQSVCQLHSNCSKIIEGLNQQLMTAEAEKENIRSDINKLPPPPPVKPKPSLRSSASQTTSSIDIFDHLRHYKILAQKNEKLLTNEKANREKEVSGLKYTVTDLGKKLAETCGENDKLKGSLTFFAEEQERYKSMIKKPVATSDGETQCDILQNLLERAKRGEKGLKFPKGFPNYEEEINETRRLKERVAVLEGWEARCLCKGKSALSGNPSLSYGSMVKPRLRTTNVTPTSATSTVVKPSDVKRDIPIPCTAVTSSSQEQALHLSFVAPREEQQFTSRVQPTPQASGTLLYPQQSRPTQLVSAGQVLQQPQPSGPQGEQPRLLGPRLEQPSMTQRQQVQAQGEPHLPPSVSQPKPPVVYRQHPPSVHVNRVQPVQQRQVPQLVAQFQQAASPQPKRQPGIPHRSSIFDDVPQKTQEEWADELQQMIDDIPDCSGK